MLYSSDYYHTTVLAFYRTSKFQRLSRSDQILIYIRSDFPVHHPYLLYCPTICTCSVQSQTTNPSVQTPYCT